MKTKTKSLPLLLENGSNDHTTQEEIAVRAHALWEQDGSRQGRDVDHWLQAEVQLRQAGQPDALQI